MVRSSTEEKSSCQRTKAEEAVDPGRDPALDHARIAARGLGLVPDRDRHPAPSPARDRLLPPRSAAKTVVPLHDAERKQKINALTLMVLVDPSCYDCRNGFIYFSFARFCPRRNLQVHGGL